MMCTGVAKVKSHLVALLYCTQNPREIWGKTKDTAKKKPTPPLPPFQMKERRTERRKKNWRKNENKLIETTEMNCVVGTWDTIRIVIPHTDPYEFCQ